MAIKLEKYNRGRGRHTCPSCGHSRQFTRYLKDDGEPFADHVGLCNRKSKCGHNYTPKMYFADNPHLRKNNGDYKPKKRQAPAPVKKFESPEVLNFHTFAHVRESLGKHRDNPFMQYLFNLFPDSEDEILEVARKYYVGYFNNLTCFWQIDRKGKICKGKLLKYDAQTGKRQTIYKWKEKDENTGEVEELEMKTYWVHRILQKRGEFPEEINLKSCFFGEHLLETEKDKTVCVVEAEKTAILAALCYPKFVWLAVGAQSHLTEERMKVLGGRNAIFYPDGDAFELWKEKAAAACVLGINARVSTFIDRSATDEEKQNGFDLADYLDRQHREINDYNKFVDEFNAKVDAILTDAERQTRFDELCSEREAIAGIPFGSLSVEAARYLVETSF